MIECRAMHCADSFAFLRSMAAGATDHTITDPPYDAHTQANQIHGTAVKRFVAGGGGGAVPRLVLPFEALDGYDFISDMTRVSAGWTISFCAVEGFGDIRRAAPEHYRRGAIWYKPNAQGQMTGDRPAACYEGVACLAPKGTKWNGRGSYGLWSCNSTRGKPGRHPSEKPIPLLLKLLALFTLPDSFVFDPFCGSGAIGVACKILGRHYLGLDQDPKWVEESNARIARVTQGILPEHEARYPRVPHGPIDDERALTFCTAKRSEIEEEPSG